MFNPRKQVARVRQSMGRVLAAAALPLALALPLTLGAPSAKAQATDAFIGTIQSFGYNFCPRGWAEADGQLLPVSQYDALFSLFGTIYGGDGRTTFGLPDLRGRANINYGSGPGLTPYQIGARGGVETVTLTTNQLPSHSHVARGNNANADVRSLSGSVLATGVDASGSSVAGYASTNGTQALDGRSVELTGGSQSHINIPPFQTIIWCVALVGLYPSRS